MRIRAWTAQLVSSATGAQDFGIIFFKVKYKYLYQTKDNENREGEIKAANRAEAYAALRKQGIRPYRVIGDDPPPWRKRVLVVAAAVLPAVIAAAALLVARTGSPSLAPQARAQLLGDAQYIAKGVATSWEDVFDTAVDRYLAAYAQPGWSLEPQTPSPEEAAAFAGELAVPLRHAPGERDEVRQLKNIVLKMRDDMRAYLDAGGDVADYLEFLVERQNHECELREKAREALARAPESMRRRAWANLNVRLADMGIAPLPDYESPDGEPPTSEEKE